MLFSQNPGPEEDCHSSSDDLSSKNEGNWPYSYLDAPPMIGSNSEFDRKHARDFTKSLAANLIPKLLKFRSSVEVDEAIQDFASNICQENSLNYSDFDYNLTAINADGIYLATYSALLLSFELMKSGHYENPEVRITILIATNHICQNINKSYPISAGINWHPLDRTAIRCLRTKYRRFGVFINRLAM